MAFTDSEQKDYVEYRRKVTTDRSFREAEVNKCLSGFNTVPGSVERFSIIMDLPKEKVPATACKRFEKAWLKGKISPHIYINYKKGFTTPEAIRVLQGRD